MPWWPTMPPLMAAHSLGSTATMRTMLFQAFRYSATPVMVPPLPTPMTTASMLSPAAFKICGPVTRRWYSGLSSLAK